MILNKFIITFIKRVLLSLFVGLIYSLMNPDYDSFKIQVIALLTLIILYSAIPEGE